MSSDFFLSPSEESDENPMQDIPTLVDLLGHRAHHQPTDRAYTFLLESGEEEAYLTYQQLDRAARSVAVQLSEAGALPGDRVLLLYPPGLDYIVAFFGCLHAGVIAIPAYPPNPIRPERRLPRLLSIIDDAKPNLALATETIVDLAPRLAAMDSRLTGLKWLATHVGTPPNSAWKAPAIGPESLAFLQYTSGSTSAPKGVMVTHRNLLHNQGLIQRSFGYDSHTKFVGWLPLYHDMGLIGNVLQPLYLGIPCVLMAPVTFLRKPLRWLQAITKYGGTSSGAPNFAYDLCVAKTTPEQRAGLDLSTWTVAFNGAEPVRADTMDRFAEAFADVGFQREAFFPCYGLAEATLFVSGGTPGSGGRIKALSKEALATDRLAEPTSISDTQNLVSCGHSEQRMVVVDPTSCEELEDGSVGEIWIAGESVAHGYWNRPEQTATTFQATLSRGEDSFLRTGDLGFADAGEVYVTGRLKDLLIVRGRNHYPQDIEATAQKSHPALREGCGAAFSIDGPDGELVAFVQEVERSYRRENLEPVIATMRAQVAASHEVHLANVTLVSPGSILKTSSGKIQRRACRSALLAGELKILASSDLVTVSELEPRGLIPQKELLLLDPDRRVEVLATSLCESLGTLLRVPRVTPDEVLANLGLDSMMAVELQHSIDSCFDVELSSADLLGDVTVDALASDIVDRISDPGSSSKRPADPTESTVWALSEGQQALYFLAQREPASTAYTIGTGIRITGALEEATFETALVQLTQRHRLLRSRVESRGGELHWIENTDPIQLELDDCSGWSDSHWSGIFDETSNFAFDLESGPLLKARLLKASPDEHVLLLSVHHIVSDLWSMAVLIRDLCALYHSELSASIPTSTGREYGDYLRWQQEWMSDGHEARSWEHWQKQLGGNLPVLDLPSDRKRPAAPRRRAGRHRFELDPNLTQQLIELGRSRGTTLFTVLLAGYQVWLHRQSGQEEILVGSPTTGRARSEFADIIGYFVNPVVLRADLHGDPIFDSFLRTTRNQVLEALAHQDYPFPRLVQRLDPDRNDGDSPLVQTLFNLLKAKIGDRHDLSAMALGEPGARVDLGGWTLESIELPPPTASFDLALSMAEVDDHLRGVFDYDRDLWDESSLDRMALGFEVLLRDLVAHPDRRISQLEMLTESERHCQLVDWNNTELEFSNDLMVHQLIEQQVKRSPNSVAVSFENQQLSYSTLNERANQLAHHLGALGVGPESRIGVAMHRSLETAIALLAVLKSGGAYIPLDPSYPSERLDFMIEDSGLKFLLSQRTVSLAPKGATSIFLDGDWDWLDEYPRSNPQNGVQEDQLAYLIYTSGTTGRPKGVMITHAGIRNRLLWGQGHFPLSQNDRVLQQSSLSFDVTVLDFFWPLLAGAQLVLARPDGQKDPRYLVDLIRDEGITTAQFVPSLLSVFLEQEGVEDCRELRCVICGGEALNTALRDRFFSRLSAELHNFYGPTEISIDATTWFCGRNGEQGPVPIGRPIANTQTYILGPHFELMPVGVPGELFIGGVGVARGYWNRPGLTAEKFVPNPFSGRPGARLFRTGDLARYRSDGEIEFLGRSDHQVKLRGQRIELEEIEAVLVECQGVNEAAVILWGEGEDQRLVAYGAASPNERAESPLSDTQIRSDLRRVLPSHMVPATIVFLDSLPLTSNGKIDRQRLPDPPERSTAIAKLDVPRTPVEELIAGIWSSSLKVDPIVLNDDFFALGGHSLLVQQVSFKIEETLGVRLPIESFFEAPVLRDLAVRVSELASSPPPAIRPRSKKHERQLSFAQQRLWLIEQLDPGSSSYVAASALRLRGLLDRSALEHSLETIVGRHEILRTVYPALDGKPVVRLLGESPLAWNSVDLRDLSPEDREKQAEALREEEARRPFDLETGPLFRSSLVQLADDDFLLLLSAHHIVLDGTHDVFHRELSEIYAAYVVQRKPSLPVLPLQYADFATWQRESLTPEVIEDDLAYWRENLGTDFGPLQLPTDRPRPAVQTSRGGRHQFMIPHALQSALEKLSRDRSLTLFMTVLAAFEVLLHRYSGADSISVGTPMVHRGSAQTSQLIGPFVNSLIIRTELRDNPTFSEVLLAVRQATLGAYAHQQLPFEMLVEALQPPRDLSHNPLFQVMFVLQPDPYLDLALPELEVSGQDVDTGAARFDMLLGMWTSPEGLRGTVEYNSDLFDAATIERLMDHFEILLEGAAAAPETRIGDLPLLSSRDLNCQLESWNNTISPYSEELLLQRCFENQVAADPTAIAVVTETTSLTYAELEEQANRLAHHLQSIGVGRGRRVAVLLERTEQMIVAVLGILKAGGCYVPFEVSYPKKRCQWILSRLEVRCLVTQSSLLAGASAIGEQTPCLETVVLLDEPLSDTPPLAKQDLSTPFDWRDQPTSRPPCASKPGDLAYIIFTSGSTGDPKGVMVQHRPVINLIEWVNQSFNVGKRDRVLFVTSLCFDLSVYDIFGTLAAGASIRVAAAEEKGDPERLVKILSEEPITFWDSAPAALDQLTPFFPEASIPQLRLVFLSGDWIPVTLPDQVRATFPGAEVISLGGATEAAIWSNFYPIGTVDPSWQSIPYGRPIQNARYYVLDDRMNPCPVGVPGELFIGGDCLALGYAEAPDLSAERFLPDPFANRPGARMYRTGDRVHFLPDGNIIFLGRLDFQVKIRGFRIELGEIEVVLGKHPAIKEAILMVRKETGDQRLVAYYTSSQGQPTEVSTLRRYVKEHLPEYMVPATFVRLDEWPLTANGKVDRKALPSPQWAGSSSQGQRLEPRNEKEAVLARIWSEILDLEAVGVHDDFFELGGHSLAAFQIVTQIRTELGIDLPLRTLFEAPTIASLSETLGELTTVTAESEQLTLVAEDPAAILSIEQILAAIEELPEEFAETSEKDLLKSLE